MLLKHRERDLTKKNPHFFSVNVFSTKVLIGDTIFTSPTGDGTAISSRGHPNHSKVQPFAAQGQSLYFSSEFLTEKQTITGV